MNDHLKQTPDPLEGEITEAKRRSLVPPATLLDAVDAFVSPDIFTLAFQKKGVAPVDIYQRLIEIAQTATPGDSLKAIQMILKTGQELAALSGRHTTIERIERRGKTDTRITITAPTNLRLNTPVPDPTLRQVKAIPAGSGTHQSPPPQ
jgi:hypothetical protein